MRESARSPACQDFVAQSRSCSVADAVVGAIGGDGDDGDGGFGAADGDDG